jgi:undecaprenyl pyrophosphate synthase
LKPVSSTQEIPSVSAVPTHVAIIMDGNGRWALNRHLPRTAGHAKGVRAVRKVVEYCRNKNVSHLTLFAFSSENWRRPADEVSLLMRLFVQALDREVAQLKEHDVRLRSRRRNKQRRQTISCILRSLPITVVDGMSCKPPKRCWNTRLNLQKIHR